MNERVSEDLSAVTPDPLAEHFEALRPRLLRIAYALIGSMEEAEAVLQHAWLRARRTDADEIEDLQAWLTVVVSRLALDVQRSRSARREPALGPSLPEPCSDAPSVRRRTTGLVRAGDVSLALLAGLESLSANERIAFVLHDVFGYTSEEVAGSLQTSPATVRQLASRARRAVEARRPLAPATPEQQRKVVLAFARAARSGDFDALMEVLHDQIVFTVGGADGVSAARKPIAAAERLVRLTKPLRAKAIEAGGRVELVDVNGMPGLMSIEPDRTVTVMDFTIDDGRILAIDVQGDPK
jgi:RNA polymerase sigma-70 factor (ECF subfamily)